jgi:hypothetical protein
MRAGAFVVDTGASNIVLRAWLYDALARDGRGQCGTRARTILGESIASNMRLRSVGVGGAFVSGAPASKDETAERLLDAIEIEIGRRSMRSSSARSRARRACALRGWRARDRR